MSTRTVVVTGASSGIGKAITSCLLQEGWQVIGISRTPSDETSPHYRFLAADLSDWARLPDKLADVPAIDAIVHAAGFMRTAPLGALNAEDGAAMWMVHVQAASVLVNTLLNRLSTGGRIVLLGSRTANGAAGRSQYAASKAALLGMARSWAAELAPRQITVNVLAPGATETPMLLAPERAATPPRLPPIGRYVQPAEVAGLAAFLLGPYAGAITGQQIVMCGGSSL